MDEEEDNDEEDDEAEDVDEGGKFLPGFSSCRMGLDEDFIGSGTRSAAGMPWFGELLPRTGRGLEPLHEVGRALEDEEAVTDL